MTDDERADLIRLGDAREHLLGAQAAINATVTVRAWAPTVTRLADVLREVDDLAKTVRENITDAT